MQKKNIFLLIIFCVAILARASGVASRPIWYDEAFSILFAEKGLSTIVTNTISANTNLSAAEEHPPAYYLLLWGWMFFFGRSIAAARIFSILISLISLYLVYKITKKLFNQRVALFACGIFAILPFQIHFAQEIRMYALLSLWLLLATFSFLKTQENKKWWIIFSLSCALAQYTHNLAAIYLIPFSLTPIFQKDWKTLRNLILAGLVSLTLYLPWLIHLPAQLSKVNSHYWVEKPGIEKIFSLILFYLPHLPLPNILLIIGLLFALLIIALGFFQTYLGVKYKIPNTSRGLWLAYLSFTPPLLLWMVSQFIPIYVERALLPSHAIFCIWLAWAFTQIKSPRLIQSMVTIMVLTCAVIGFYQHLTYKGFPYGQFDQINKSIQNRIISGDVVVHSSKLSYLPAFYFDQTFQQGFIIDSPGSTVDTLAPATREILKLTEYETIEQATINASRVWFIIYKKSVEEYITAGNSTHPHLAYLNENFFLTATEQWGEIQIFLYEKNNP